MQACVAVQRDVGFLVDRHKAHQPHERTDALLVHRMAIVAQVPRHLTNAKERRVEELHVDQPEPPRVYRRVKLSKDDPYDTTQTYPVLHS